MRILLNKEMRFSAPLITYLFLAASLLTLTPGYPILVGAFFLCFGVFQFFQTCREANDVLYTAMLPVEKADVVRAKYAFTLFIELSGFAVMVLLTILRMWLLPDAAAYRNNALMNANPAFLGYALMIFAAFNSIFLVGFFKTGYKLGMPFLGFGITAFLVIGIAEALHFFPGMGALNDTRFASVQLFPLLAGVIVFGAGTILSQRRAIRYFYTLDI